MIELTDIELLKDFIIIEYDGKIYDLHSDYECKAVVFDGAENKMTLQFYKRDSSTSNSSKVAIEFNEARLANFSLLFPYTQDSSTLNIIYRGRFEEQGEVREHSEDGERYFYFELEAGDKFEVYSKRVIFSTTT
jgi:hypothetical protein